MKKNIEKRMSAGLGAFAGMMSAAGLTAFAQSSSDSDITAAAGPIVGFLSGVMPPLLAIVAAVGILYCVILGIKYARTETPQEREAALEHLKSAVIGFVIIFVLFVALSILTDSIASRPPETPKA